MVRLSVIIPALNEAEHLPTLLEALKNQTRPPDEIIVADAGSTDGTVELAQARGARIIPGGMPGPGRNAGARAARGDLLLFLDADVVPPPDFIELGLAEFIAGGYTVATCITKALSDDLSDKIIMEAVNLYIQIIQPISPRAPGFCIFADREIHQQLGGFDETLKMSEDHDYARRAAQQGEFGVLTSIQIPVSMRRLEKEGLTGLALKYLWCEMYALAGKPIRSIPFEYEFGAFQPSGENKGPALMDIAELRARLGQFENPIQHLSHAGQEQFHRLLESDPWNTAEEYFRLLLERHDIEMLENYLQRRLTLIREHPIMSKSWTKIKNISGESIRILESAWRWPFRSDRDKS